MKKIEFLWLDIKNFMSIEDSKIIFKPGTTLLLGENKDSIAADDNGAGKSTVAEALRWCLYGETVRGSIDKSLSVDHVCREWSKKKTDVCLQFMYDDLPVFVQRIRTKTKGDLLVQIGTSAVHKNIAAVKALDDILGVNVMQFANLVHLDGSYPYLFAPASDRERKEILADLVDMAITEVMQAEVKTRLGPIEAELGALRDSWTEKGILISHHKNTVDETRTEGMAAKGLLNQLRKEWSSLNIEVSNYTTEKEKLEEENDEQTAKFAVDITAKVAEQCELSSTIELKWKEKSIVSSSYLKSELDEANKALYSKRSNINSIKIRINGIKKLQAEGKCSTCGQDTTEVQTHELESLMSQVKGLDGEVQRDSATLEAIESKKKRKLNILLDEVKTLDKARDRCQCQLEELQRADQVYHTSI
jgi:DNA repair exonuclease SbcCD ATPase subunit